MKNDVNLNSYEGVEQIQSTYSDSDFEQYCNEKLESCAYDLDFIKKHIYVSNKLNVCEIGTGNGKLLFALERSGILRGGVGYEVSKSRCKCAERFKKLMGCTMAEIVNQNFLEDRSEKNLI